MAEIVKPDMNLVWASGGALIAPSSTKVQQGWTSEIPPHQWENWVQNRQDACLLYLMQKGIPEWDNSTEYWANRSFVQRSGNLYKAIRNNTNADPLTSGSDWTNAIPTATTTTPGLAARATQTEAIAGTDDTKFITPKTLKDKLDSPTTGYLKASNNLSEITNAATARANLDIRASNTVNAGLIRVATASESTARTSEVIALSPAGLARNIQNSLNDSTSGRLMTVGAFGLGAGAVSPPNDRTNLNPMGWYYSTQVPSFGGGAFFLELPYNSTTGGMRFSTDPYTNKYYLNSWDNDNSTFREKVELWHTGNFQASDYAIKTHTHTIAQVTGLQAALDAKQNNLGYVPVNKSGDTITGNLTINSGILNINEIGGESWTKSGWGVGQHLGKATRWYNQTGAAFGFGVDTSSRLYLIAGYASPEAVATYAFDMGLDGIIHFHRRPNVGTQTVAVTGDVPKHFGDVVEFGSIIVNASWNVVDLPDTYVMTGISGYQDGSGNLRVHARGKQLKI